MAGGMKCRLAKREAPTCSLAFLVITVGLLPFSARRKNSKSDPLEAPDAAKLSWAEATFSSCNRCGPSSCRVKFASPGQMVWRDEFAKNVEFAALEIMEMSWQWKAHPVSSPWAEKHCLESAGV